MIRENPPTTLDELREAAIARTDPSKNQYGLGLPTDYGYYWEYLWANGGDVINEDATQNLLNSEENIKPLEWIQKLATEDGVSPGGTHRSGCGHDVPVRPACKCIPAVHGTSTGWTQLGLNYGITAILAEATARTLPEGGCSYMLTKGADEQTKEAVYKFMAYWLSDDVLKSGRTGTASRYGLTLCLRMRTFRTTRSLGAVSKASEIDDWHLGLECGSMIDNDVMKPMMEKNFIRADVTQSGMEASDALDAVISD